MSPRPPQGSAGADHYAYIPAGAQQALAKQMQQAVPAHLKQYVSGNAGYVPPRVQQELTSYMQKAAPAHLQEYASAYVQQNVVDPSVRSMASRPTSVTPPPPAANRRNLSHSSAVGGEQADATTYLNLFNTEGGRPTSEQSPQPTQPAPSGQYIPENPAPASPTAHYDFILNPAKPPKAPGSGSIGKRLAVVAGVGVVLLIAIILVGSLLGGKSGGITGIITVAQEQTEVMRVAGQAAGHTNTPRVRNLVTNTTLTLTSSQQQLLAYLKQNHQKVDDKVLALKHSTQTDSSLSNAVATNTFDPVFVGILQNDLANYAQAVRTAYKASPGPKGKALLQKEYDSAQLLIQQSKEQ